VLRALDIRDMLIIDRLELAFQPGLNVLTGETGAGKSILLDSLGFVLGWRGRADLVRQGAKQGEVVAEFDLHADHPAHAVLENAGLPDDGETLLLRRVNSGDGRKTAWVNDRRVSGEVLRALSETLIELHGQHDDRGLLNPKGHRDIVDGFANAADLLAACQVSWKAWRNAEVAATEARQALAAIRAEEETLRADLAELDQLDPKVGEMADLETRRATMKSAKAVAGDIGEAARLISFDGGARGESGAAGLTMQALRALSRTEAALGAQAASALAALEQAADVLNDAESEVSRLVDALNFDESDLARVDDRFHALRDAMRKFSCQADDLAPLMMQKQASVDSLDAGEGGVAEKEAAATVARQVYDDAATALSDLRRRRAVDLDRAVMAELAPLKMERAIFETQISDTTPGPSGRDMVAFTVATNPGAPAGPLNKIASGGELSRFLLALKVCLADDVTGVTMIFDEIDRGVGGATADAVGRRLSALADGGQVLVVTHSPQVAALGAHHWRVSKQVVQGATLSSVEPLSGDQRVDEIARMLAGDTITSEARAAARALL
jgi:DNA repair protein RecN (Recombination protein N)